MFFNQCTPCFDFGEEPDEEIDEETELFLPGEPTTEPKIIHGITISDSAQETRKTFRTSTLSSSLTTSTQWSTNLSSQEESSDVVNDEEDLVIFDVHDTIRQINLPAIKKKTKTGARPLNKLLTKNLQPRAISSVKGFYCKCKEQCSDELTFNQIEAERKHYWNLDQTARKQYLIDKLVFDLSANHERAEVDFKFTVQGKEVYGPFFRNVYPLSFRTYCDVRTRVRQRNTNVRKRERTNDLQKHSQNIVEYLDVYAETNGEPQPNKQDIHFPQGVGKNDVYTSFLADMYEEGDKVPTIRHFYRVWRSKRKQYKCPKWSTFSKCSICTDIKFQIESGGGREAKGKSF